MKWMIGLLFLLVMSALSAVLFGVAIMGLSALASWSFGWPSLSFWQSVTIALILTIIGQLVRGK